MARMTPESDAWVIRLVYDGPPLSGKSTSVHALAGGLARSVFSLADQAGRTEYFDWLEYVGGSFEGIPIRCQILSVPGQGEHSARRHSLLAGADAVVFVLNSTPQHVSEAAACLQDLQRLLASRPSPRPGVVVQANHRDHPDALPVADLRAALEADGLTIIESVATEHQGIREAFVLAVRLALERVQELVRQELLDPGDGELESPEALLAHLRALEGIPVTALPPAAAPPAPGTPPPPRLPDTTVPAGRVWPPVEGRMALHPIPVPGPAPSLGQDGAWRLRRDGWHFHSGPGQELTDLAEGQKSLLTWAHHYTRALDRLSAQRCVVLAETGHGSWRLWQVVRSQSSLRQRLHAAWREAGPAGLARGLPNAVALLLAARQAFAVPCPLPWRLDLIGKADDGSPLYIGLLPPPGWSQPEEGLAPSVLAQREIATVIGAARKTEGWDADEFLDELRQASAAASPAGPAVREVLDGLLSEG